MSFQTYLQTEAEDPMAWISMRSDQRKDRPRALKEILISRALECREKVSFYANATRCLAHVSRGFRGRHIWKPKTGL